MALTSARFEFVKIVSERVTNNNTRTSKYKIVEKSVKLWEDDKPGFIKLLAIIT